MWGMFPASRKVQKMFGRNMNICNFINCIFSSFLLLCLAHAPHMSSKGKLVKACMVILCPSRIRKPLITHISELSPPSAVFIIAFFTIYFTNFFRNPSTRQVSAWNVRFICFAWNIWHKYRSLKQPPDGPFPIYHHSAALLCSFIYTQR